MFLTKANLFERWIASLLAYSKALSCNPTLFCFTATIFIPLLHFSISKKHDVTDFKFLVQFMTLSLLFIFLLHHWPFSSHCSLLDHPSSSQSLKVVDFKAQSSTSTSCNSLYGISPYPIQFHHFNSHMYVQDSYILSSTTNS